MVATAANRRSRRLAGEEPELFAAPASTNQSKSYKKVSFSAHEEATEWKRLGRLQSCLFAGKLLATSFASLITFTTTYNWYTGILPSN